MESIYSPDFNSPSLMQSWLSNEDFRKDFIKELKKDFKG
jgi:hypothetical protein